jgi:hypothetical protein
MSRRRGSSVRCAHLRPGSRSDCRRSASARCRATASASRSAGNIPSSLASSARSRRSRSLLTRRESCHSRGLPKGRAAAPPRIGLMEGEAAHSSDTPCWRLGGQDLWCGQFGIHALYCVTRSNVLLAPSTSRCRHHEKMPVRLPLRAPIGRSRAGRTSAGRWFHISSESPSPSTRMTPRSSTAARTGIAGPGSRTDSLC